MGLQVIGAGFGRTGTTSLKSALEMLGFGPCYHMFELVEHREHIPLWAAARDGADIDWMQIFQNYHSSLDWPACTFWKQTWKAFPDAKIILSVRDPDAWYESVNATLYPTMMNAPHREGSLLTLARDIVLEDTFGGQFEDKDRAISVYNAHIETVKKEVPSESLLVYAIGDGWGPLCQFLDCQEPTQDYPRKNTRKDFHNNAPAASAK